MLTGFLKRSTLCFALLAGCVAEVGSDEELALEEQASELVVAVRTKLTTWTTNSPPVAGLVYGTAYYYSYLNNLYAIGTEIMPRFPGTPKVLCTGCQARELATDGTNLYFSSTANGGRIARLPLAGGPVTTLVSNAGTITTGFGLSGDFVYYASSGNIMRVAKTSGTPQAIVQSVSAAIAVGGSTLCWNGNGGLYCRNLSTNVDTRITGQGGVRTGLYVNNNYVYWADDDGSIKRSSVTSPMVTTVKNPDPTRRVREMVANSERVFFIDRPATGDSTQRRIGRVPLSGGNGGTLYGQDATTVGAVGLSLRGDELYWGDNQGIEGAPNYPLEFLP